MATLKEFEDALREHGLKTALAVLETLRERDRAKRAGAAPARRIAGRKMTPDVARRIMELHAATQMTQQEIAFQLGVNQGRVNEVIKRGKWLSGDPSAPEARARDKAVGRIVAPSPRNTPRARTPRESVRVRDAPRRGEATSPRREPAVAPGAQLTFL